MLTLERCQKLKEWGFSQDRKGDFWCIDTKDIFFDDGAWAKESPDQYFACPNLEELLEWAKDKLKELFGKKAVIEILNGERGGWGVNGFEIIRTEAAYFATDPDPKIAIYKLLKQVLETGGE